MAGIRARTWALAVAWPAVVDVTAIAYGVEPELLRAQSQGRGPRPPERAREPKKVAIYLLVILSGADYAAAARHLGLHKDTVASHCAEVRGWADDDTVDRNLDILAASARVKLDIDDTATVAATAARARLGALQAFMAEVFDRAWAALPASDEPSDPSSDAPKKSRTCELRRAAA